MANFSAEVVAVDLPDVSTWDEAELVLGNLADAPAHPASTPLRPWEARILRHIRS